jgi:hypothetical protein
VLGEVEETIYTVDEEDEGGNGEVRTVKKQSEMLFVRGMWRLCLRTWNDGERERLTLEYRRLGCPYFAATMNQGWMEWLEKRTGITRSDSINTGGGYD